MKTFRLDESRVIPDAKRHMFLELKSGARRPVLVLGCNYCAQCVARQIEVTAFVDDFTTETTFMDKPIIRAESVPQGALVVSCATNWPLSALRRLHAAVRNVDVIDYFALNNLDRLHFPDIVYFENCREDIDANRDKYASVYERLADETSREQFVRICNFRYTMNLDWLKGFASDVERQYFDGFIRLAPNEVFVDGGGYDGETTLRFARHCAQYKSIYYFEPTPGMMEASRHNLETLKNVTFIQKGLASQKATLSFDASRGVGNRLSGCGETKIEVVRMDDAVGEQTSYIKLDIEGAEYDALLGASRHMQLDRPKMAVCVYHNQSDFWRIPELLSDHIPKYDLYFRHYGETVESVLYHIPKSLLNKQTAY